MNTKRIQDNNAIIQACIDKVNNLSIPEAVELPEYEGEYIITPSVEQQTMQTKNKAMNNDVTILAIPYAEVTNNTGGKTVTIG